MTRASSSAIAVACAAAWLGAGEGSARAQSDVEAFARVVVDAADIRSGPGVSYRVLYTAHRGETLAIAGRPGPGFWLRVTLPDGRTAYALGDEVQPFEVRPGQEGPDSPSRPGFFAPPPLTGARVGVAIVGGVFATAIADGGEKAYGYMEIRPSLVLHETITLDAFVGDALTADGSQLFYGGGLTFHVAPRWPICPFLSVGGGGLSVIPNSDSFVLHREDLFVARAGGGLLLALRGRILVRAEVTNMTLFAPDTFRNAQTYSIGFGAYF
jgi:hypothetical protein